MAIVKERAEGYLPPWIRHELACRYEFAARFVDGKIVLDCASADGRGSEMLARAGARQVVGLDISVGTILASPRRRGVPRLDLAVADAVDLPVADRSVDVFVSLETLEHLAGQEAMVAEVCRVLRRDGVFICSSPNRPVYSPGHGPGDRPWNPYHVRELSAAELADLLSRWFGSVTLYGQNPTSTRQVRWMSALARWLPGHGAVRVRQALKLFRFVSDSVERHRVRSREEGLDYELLVALASEPRRP